MTRLSFVSELPHLSHRRVARLRAAFWAVEEALLGRTVRRIWTGAWRFERSVPVIEPPDEDGCSRARVLRWIFSRGHDHLTCELALSDDDACYELRTIPSTRPASRSVEHFSDVSAAFERQSAFEGALVEDGWTLELYESVLLDRPCLRSIAG